jgi:hypothetical protein
MAASRSIVDDTWPLEKTCPTPSTPFVYFVSFVVLFSLLSVSPLDRLAVSEKGQRHGGACLLLILIGRSAYQLLSLFRGWVGHDEFMVPQSARSGQLRPFSGENRPPAVERRRSGAGQGCKKVPTRPQSSVHFLQGTGSVVAATSQKRQTATQTSEGVEMTNHWTTTMALAALLAFGTTALAAEEKAAKANEPAQAKTAAAQDAPTVAQLQARLHRTMAALIEARSAEQPDQAQIDKLTRRVQSLRQQIFARGPEANVGTPCPWGGPGLGLGRGAGYGWGRGYGAGYGGGRGYGRGPGYGRGAGWGAAHGYPGRGFIDQDEDGVCDNYELRQNQ